MFSPLNDPYVAAWFRRLDASWRRMPAEEQARQREEVQQHLDGLAAANIAAGQSPEDAWNAALEQFGDPTQIGRNIYQEWGQSRTGFRADMTAILFGFGLSTLWLVIPYVASLLLMTCIPSVRIHHGISASSPILRLCGYGWVFFCLIATGRKYPFQAIRGVFYPLIILCLWDGILVGNSVLAQHGIPTPWFSAKLSHSLLVLPFWATGEVAIAYLASVTKRGWYRPSLADFKITPPSDTKQISR